MDKTINANPTKGFFINMLTRDIRLDRAIIDLIDNSIDGAKNLKSNENYNGLGVKLKISGKSFEISDNCGGFPLEVAKNYAFRFGRPDDPDAAFVKHSIGRFGVGMKRSLFKMGRHFTVESKHKNDHYLIEVDVDQWVKDEEWTFDYIEKDEISNSKLNGIDGTVITVDNLYESIEIDFKSSEFKNKLKKEVGLAVSYSLLKNLTIEINNDTIERTDIIFLEKQGLKPLSIKKKFKNVNVQIYAGIGDYSPPKAGWYIFCNDRLVLQADKSYTTGWKEDPTDDGSVIKYHNDYAMFRGAVFFDADDSSQLPMTTTKTGIDSDHPVFKSSRPLMLTAMRQIIKFLKKIDNKDEGEAIINNSENVNVTEMRTNKTTYTNEFIYPATKVQEKANKYVGIHYKKEREIVEKVKDFAGVSSNGEVGSITFDFFCNSNEIK